MIPQPQCARCGSAEPAEVVELNTAERYLQDLNPEESHSICHKCRKSFRRWLRRPHSR